MPWAWHKLQCCCEEVVDCYNYVPCCINGVEAKWAIRDVPSGAGSEQGITKSVHFENLCESGPGGLGDDWSQYIGRGDPQQWSKEPATRDSVGSPPVSSFQTNFGCLTGVTIDPKDLVCSCSSTYNFKLTVEVMSCVPPEPEPTTYYVETPAAELCFDIGDGSTGGYDCCMLLSGYSIDGGGISTVLEADNWVPIEIPDEDTSVKVHFYFKHNPDCIQCIDTAATGAGNTVVADILETALLSPQKECFKLACGRNTGGFAFPFVPEAFDTCTLCKPSSSLGTAPNLDGRSTICYNCLWERDIFGGESYPNDADCKCGCATGCTELRNLGNNAPATRGRGGYCVAPNITDSGDSSTGSDTICITEDISDGVDALIWHAIVPDGCPDTPQNFSFSKYVGPYGSVTSTAANHPTGKIFGTDVQPAACAKMGIAWNNVINGTDGGGNNCYDISMTINGETWTVNNCPGPSPLAVRNNLLWKVDHGC